MAAAAPPNYSRDIMQERRSDSTANPVPGGGSDDEDEGEGEPQGRWAGLWQARRFLQPRGPAWMPEILRLTWFLQVLAPGGEVIMIHPLYRELYTFY
jgi:hypothetical protein